MNRDHWFLIALALLGAYNAGAVWLAQISGYPLWPFVGKGEFTRYYAAWSGSATILINGPLLLALLVCVGALWVHPRGIAAWPLWVMLLLQVSIVALTYFWWTPSTAQLTSADGSLNSAAFAQLAQTHWLRVALVTIYASLSWWMLGHAFFVTAPGSTPTKGWLLLVTAAFAVVGAGQVWIVQTLCYRIWPYVGKNTFFDYHMAWWHSIWTVIFVPSGLTLIGIVALLRWRPPQTDVRLVWAGFWLQVLLCTLTAAWWGPLMGRLATRVEGLLLHRYDLMMTTHWVRVAIVNAYGFVATWMLVQSAFSSCGLFKPRG